MNDITLNPVSTLHVSSGKLASETFWYEPNNSESRSNYSSESGLAKLFDFERWVRKRLKGLPYKEKLENFIIQYVRALDSTDWDKSFLKLWRILESATATAERDSHEDMIRRVAFIFKDHDFHHEILKHLKYYVETFLDFLLFKTNGLGSLDEVKKFIDMPVDSDALKNKYKEKTRQEKELKRDLILIKRAAQFHQLSL